MSARLMFSLLTYKNHDCLALDEGLGTGDNKFEEMKVNYQNEIDEVIKKLLKSNTFSIDGNNLFLGGNSKSKLNLIRKYSLGINQWGISKMNLEIKSEIYKLVESKNYTLANILHSDLIFVNKFLD